MRLWRLSSLQFAQAMDGGYGLRFDGRWNTVGRPVTYAATSSSLCVLEQLVQIEDPTLLPVLAMMTSTCRTKCQLLSGRWTIFPKIGIGEKQRRSG
jgi:RES domain-containing protein